ncbi:hypothetical protein B566_EDAN012255 [Ephemera danica]|nr:hypothetical protein B566_EDAN012255 [Ephemera danica]
MMQFLVSLKPQAAITARNNDGFSLLMLYAKEHDVNIVHLMLSLGADPNICSNSGNTALMLAVSKIPVYFERISYIHNFDYDLFNQERQSNGTMCQHVVDLLIQRGADVDICNVKGENALHIAVKNLYTFHLEILQSLIYAGIDPTVETREQCSVLSYAMKTFIELCAKYRSKDAVAKEAYKALHFLYNLVPFQRETFHICCSLEKQPQTILLKHLSCCQIITGNKSIFGDLIVSKKNLFNPSVVALEHIHYVNNSNQNHKLEVSEFSMGFLAVNLNHERFIDSSWSSVQMSSFGRTLLENVKYLLSIGFSANLPGTISPLTVGLLHLFPHFHYAAFAKVMLNNGVHVEQRISLESRCYIGAGQDVPASLCSPWLDLAAVYNLRESLQAVPVPVLLWSAATLNTAHDGEEAHLRLWLVVPGAHTNIQPNE